MAAWGSQGWSGCHFGIIFVLHKPERLPCMQHSTPNNSNVFSINGDISAAVVVFVVNVLLCTLHLLRKLVFSIQLSMKCGKCLYSYLTRVKLSC